MELRPVVAPAGAPPRPDGDGGVDLDVVVDGLTVGRARYDLVMPSARVRHWEIAPEHRGRGLGRELLGALTGRLVAAGATSVIVTTGRDQPAAAAALLRDAPISSLLMSKPIADPPAPLPADHDYRPMTPQEYDVWLADHVRSYAEAGLTRAGGDPDLALSRSQAEFAGHLPDGLDTADTSIVVLLAAGERVGDLWLNHRRPGRETFGFDLEIAPDKRGAGHGRAAMAVGERLAAAAGDVSVGLHVFGDNAVARNLYVSWGFQVVLTSHDVLAPRPDAT